MTRPIALVTEKFDPTRGGAERSIRELAAALAARDLHVTVLAQQLPSAPPADLPYTIVHLPAPARSRTARFHAFARAVNAWHADHPDHLLHSTIPLSSADVYQPRGGSILHSARRHAAANPCPLCRAARRAALPLNRARAARIRAERDLCRQPHGPQLAALSSYVADQFRTLYHLPENRIHLIPNAVDTARLTARAAAYQGHNLRQRLSPDNCRTLFLFAAENFRLKGLRELILAAARLPRQGRDFRILVAGTPNFAPYYQLARRLHLTDRIAFLGPTSRIPALLHTADAVLLPTFNDACSRLVLEALAVAKPALTTRHNGAADFLTDNLHGHLIDSPTDLDPLAHALDQLRDPDHLATLRANIKRDNLPQRVSIQRHVDQLIALYETRSP